MEEYSELEEKIIRYLEGDLDEDQKIKMEDQIEADDAIKQLVEEYKIILGGVDLWNTENLKLKIKEVNDELSTNGFFDEGNSVDMPSLFIVYYRKYGKIAAVILAIFSMIGIYFIRETNISRQNWFIAYDKPEKEFSLSLLQRAQAQGFLPGSSGNDSLIIAIQLYADGSYDRSLQILESLTDLDKHSDISKYYMGLNYMALSEINKSEIYFRELCEKEKFEFRDNACWSLSISLIKQQAPKRKILVALRKLGQSNTDIAKKANEIIPHFQ